MVSIEGLDKAAVLAALYNRSITGGMGFFHYDPTPMTVEQAREIFRSFERVTKKFLFWTIEKRPAARYIYFDYLQGRPMKVDLTSDIEFDATWYDDPAYNGEGAAEEAIRLLRETGDVNPPSTQVAHRTGVLNAAQETRHELHRKPDPPREMDVPGLGRITAFHVGLDDVADELGPKIDEAIQRQRDGE